MANSQGWGSGVDSIYYSSWSGNVVYRDGTGPIPTAQVAANGNRPLKIHSCSANSLSNGTPEIVYQGQAWLAGRVFANSTPGGNFRFQCRNNGGTMNVGRASVDGGTIVDAGDGDTRTGSIPGSMQWSGSSSAPRTPGVTGPLPARNVITWVAPSDLGGETVLGYRITRATDAGFTAGVTHFDVGNVLTYTDTTAAPGVRYWYKIACKNAVTNAAGTTSAYTASVNIVTKAGGRRWDGSAEVVTTNLMRWDGAAEVPITTAVRWDGSAEVPLT